MIDRISLRTPKRTMAQSVLKPIRNRHYHTYIVLNIYNAEYIGE